MEHKKKLVEDIRACLDEYKYVWIFSVGDMRTDGLQEVRNLWKGTGRIIYGKNKVVAKALGESEETEYKTGLSEIAKVSPPSYRAENTGNDLVSHAPKLTQIPIRNRNRTTIHSASKAP